MVAAAVILLKPETLAGINDSKKISAALREELYVRISRGAIVGIAELFAAAYVEEALRDVVPHLILLLVLVLRPQGLFGAVGRKKV